MVVIHGNNLFLRMSILSEFRTFYLLLRSKTNFYKSSGGHVLDYFSFQSSSTKFLIQKFFGPETKMSQFKNFWHRNSFFTHIKKRKRSHFQIRIVEYTWVWRNIRVNEILLSICLALEASTDTTGAYHFKHVNAFTSHLKANSIFTKLISQNWYCYQLYVRLA